MKVIVLSNAKFQKPITDWRRDYCPNLTYNKWYNVLYQDNLDYTILDDAGRITSVSKGVFSSRDKIRDWKIKSILI